MVSLEKEINLIELFSGIGGFALGLQKAGFKINGNYIQVYTG